MALIKCSECGKEISDKANTCPSCGNPINSQSVVTDQNSRVEIVQTSKKWKKTWLWGFLLLIGGWIMCIKSLGLGIFMMFIGFTLAIISAIGRWWTNG